MIIYRNTEVIKVHNFVQQCTENAIKCRKNEIKSISDLEDCYLLAIAVGKLSTNDKKLYYMIENAVRRIIKQHYPEYKLGSYKEIYKRHT